MERIIQLKQEDLIWPFSSSPYFSVKPGDGCPAYIKVDPFPCYPHSSDVVEQTVLKVEKAFTLPYPPYYYILSYDGEGHTNGYTQYSYMYDEHSNKSLGRQATIVLCGKRIPIHPAMTRYLVAHEYGHAVQAYIEHQRDLREDSHGISDFDREYAEMREIPLKEFYGGLRWHDNVGEIIANDFRVCVTGIEGDFYPHNVSYPLLCTQVVEFWKKMKEEYSL